MAKKKVTTRTCGKCKTAFPVGQGHNSQTCGMGKSAYRKSGKVLFKKTKKKKVGINKNRFELGQREIFKNEKEKNEGTFLVRKEIPRYLFSQVKYSFLSGEVKLNPTRSFNNEDFSFPTWAQEYNCVSDDDSTIWFNAEGLVDRPPPRPAVEYTNGGKEWWVNGKRHRLDGPAEEWADGTKIWRLNGEKHRLNGPAVEWADGGKEWWVNGKLHRLDGPAYEPVGGAKVWYANGELHRLDGPAIVSLDGKNQWYLNGERHRLDGPAVEHEDGTTSWFVAGYDMEDYSDKPEIFEIMGKNFYLLCINENPEIRKKALANPKCPLAWKIAGKLVQG